MLGGASAGGAGARGGWSCDMTSVSFCSCWFVAVVIRSMASVT